MTNDPHSIIDQNAREQLSALLDNELDGDAARFLRRRLEHDDAMVGQLVRWQLAGDVLRAHAQRPMQHEQDDLAARVRAAIERESEPQAGVAATPAAGRHGGRWLWAGGLAAAAALGFAALNMSTQMPASPVAQPVATAAAPALQTATPAAAAPARSVGIPAVGASQRVLATGDVPSNVNTSELDVPATAMTERTHAQPATRMLASAERMGSRQHSARATRAIGNPGIREKTSADPGESTAVATAAASNDTTRAVASAAATRRNPFAMPAKMETPALPWPKATIPDLDSSLNASFNRSRGSNPFVPRVPISAAAAAEQPQP